MSRLFVGRSGSLIRGFGWLAWLVSAILFVLALRQLAVRPEVGGDTIRTLLWHQGWLLLWVLVVSLLVRTRTIPQVFAAVFGGFFTSLWIAVLLGRRSAEWWGAGDVWHISVAVPLIEEAAKLLPVVVVVLIWRFRRDGSPGATDLAVLGVAAGSGFAIHEDALWGRVSGSGLDSTIGWLLPSVHTDAGLVAGHAVWTGLAGLALGLWNVNRHRRWMGVVPVLGLVVVVADHGMWNSGGLREDWRWVTLNGWLPVILFLGGLAVSLAVEHVRIRRAARGVVGKLLLAMPRLMGAARSPWNFVQRGYHVGDLRRAIILRVYAQPILDGVAGRAERKST